MFNTKSIDTLFFEDFVTSAHKHEVIEYKNTRNLETFCSLDSSTELLVADLRVSLYIQLDLCSKDKEIALKELDRLKMLEL
jgi:hypothetical protein